MDRFWSKVRKTEGCWEWTGYLCDGYGRFAVNGVSDRAHRVSYRMHYGDIPKGMLVRHRCDNRMCVRPDHLELGTVTDNNRDTVSRRRHVSQKKEMCKYEHPFTGDNFYVNSEGKRICRVCKRERSRAKRLATSA